jgi:hypothetical protein
MVRIDGNPLNQEASVAFRTFRRFPEMIGGSYRAITDTSAQLIAGLTQTKTFWKSEEE